MIEIKYNRDTNVLTVKPATENDYPYSGDFSKGYTEKILVIDDCQEAIEKIVELQSKQMIKFMEVLREAGLFNV